MPNVTVYSTSYCPYCVRAKDLLTRKGVQYTEINAEDDAARDEMIKKAGGRRTVPQIFIGDEPIGGYSDMIALHQKGQLEAKLV